MFNVVFCEDKNGYSELYETMINLAKRSDTNKDARIQFNKITYYIELLKLHGTRLPDTITKHIVDDIWELRPGVNRVLYFYYQNNTFVLLHMFRKKTQKTPTAEIEKSKREVIDYLERKSVRKK